MLGADSFPGAPSVSPSLILERADSFCRRFSLQAPILLAPMAGACPVPVPVEPSRGQILVFRGPRRLLRRSVMGEVRFDF